MTRLEAIGIVVCFGVIGGLGLWLGLSAIWGRRRVPERADFGSWLYIPIDTTPRITARGRLELARQGVRGVYFPPQPMDWLQEDPDSLFAWPERPPSARPFDQDNPRPWAHG